MKQTSRTVLTASLAALCLSGLAHGQDLPQNLAVAPILIGPLQVLITLLPALGVALGGVIVALFKPSTTVKLAKLAWAQKLPLSLVAGSACLVIFVVPSLLPASTGAAAISRETFEMYRGGPARRGFVPGEKADPTTGGRVWTNTETAETLYCAPAVAGKYVYASTAMKKVFSEYGNIVCIDAETGKLVWKDNCGNLRPTFSSPAVTDKYVVCGEGLHDCTDARVICLDRATGKRIWEFRTKQHVESSPCVYNGRVYFGAGTDGYYCLPLEPQDPANIKPEWQKIGKEFNDCETSPVAYNGKVYVGLGIDGNAVVCLDAVTGKEDWRLKTDFPVFTPPCIADDKLYVGMGNGDFVNTAEQLGKAPGGALWCIELKNPDKPLWTCKTGQVLLAAAAVAKGRVYFGSRDGYMYSAAAEDGTDVKRWNAQSAVVTSPAVANDNVYFVTANGMLYGLDAQSMDLVWEAALWTKPPGEKDYFFSSPTVANGHVYVGTATDGLLCMGKPGQAAEPLWAGNLGGPGQSGRADKSPFPNRLEQAWTYPKDAADDSYLLTVAPAYFDGSVFTAARSGGKHTLARLKLDKNPALPPSPAWEIESKNVIALSPAMKGQSLYFVDGRSGDKDRALHALDIANGHPRWKAPVEDGASGEFVIGGGSLVIADRASGLSSIAMEGSQAGKVEWTFSGGALSGAPGAADGRVFAALKDKKRLVALDRATGGELWSIEIPAPTGGAIAVGQSVVVPTESGVAAYDILDGKEQWRQEATGKVELPLAAAEGRIGCMNAEKKLFLLNAADGTLARKPDSTDADFGPLLCREGFCFFNKRGGFQRVPIGAPGKQPESWFRTRSAVSPVIIVNSHVYVGSNKGLTCYKPKAD